jgi:pilus assembly protein CpaB
MKFAVLGLCLLGLLAAASAAVLVNALRVSPVAAASGAGAVDENPEVHVLYSTRNVPSMTVVDGGMVTTRVMHKSEAPAGYLTDTAEVVGKIVAMPLAAGQSFAKNIFADLTHTKQLASVIPQGKRAVTISVTDYAGLQGLINPGSMVDVLVSFKASDSSSGRRDALATTLLQNIQVLALDQQTVHSPGKIMDDVGRQGSTRRVTLLVDTKQAKALELAMDQGTLSLTLRNPLDSTESDREIVSVHSLMGDTPPVMLRGAAEQINNSGFTAALQALAEKMAAPEASAPGAKAAAPAPKAPEIPHWDTTIIRGSEVETRSFPMPAGQTAPVAQVR